MATPLTQDLAGYFPPCKLGEVNVPTIVVDKFDRMLMVALPGAFSESRIVSHSFLLFMPHLIFPERVSGFYQALGKGAC